MPNKAGGLVFCHNSLLIFIYCILFAYMKNFDTANRYHFNQQIKFLTIMDCFEHSDRYKGKHIRVPNIHDSYDII